MERHTTEVQENQAQNKDEKKASLWQIIKEDFCVIKQKDPAINKSIELFFNYPGLIALVHYRLAHAIHNAEIGRAHV